MSVSFNNYQALVLRMIRASCISTTIEEGKSAENGSGGQLAVLPNDMDAAISDIKPYPAGWRPFEEIVAIANVIRILAASESVVHHVVPMIELVMRIESKLLHFNFKNADGMSGSKRKEKMSSVSTVSAKAREVARHVLGKRNINPGWLCSSMREALCTVVDKYPNQALRHFLEVPNLCDRRSSAVFLDMLQYSQFSSLRSALIPQSETIKLVRLCFAGKMSLQGSELRYQGIRIFHAIGSFSPQWHAQNPDLFHSILPSRIKGKYFRDVGTEGRYHEESKLMAMCMMQYFQSTKLTHPEKACDILFRLTCMLDVRTSQNFTFICRFVEDQICNLGTERVREGIITQSLALLRDFRAAGEGASDLRVRLKYVTIPTLWSCVKRGMSWLLTQKSWTSSFRALF